MAAVATPENHSANDYVSFKGADFSAVRGKFVELSATLGEASVCNGAGDVPHAIGVTNAGGTASTLPATFLPAGAGKRVLILAGGTIAIGDRVGTGASGTAVAKTADADIIVGHALMAAASGEFFCVQLGQPIQRAS